MWCCQVPTLGNSIVRKMKDSHNQCRVHPNVLIDKNLGEFHDSLVLGIYYLHIQISFINNEIQT